MSRIYSPPTVSATPAPSQAVAVHPVTGQIVPASSVKACCHSDAASSSSAHCHPARVTTHPPSDAYRTALLSVLSLAAVAGLGYGGYRLYTEYYLKRAKGAANAGVTEKRAAYPVTVITDETKFDRVLAQVEATKAPGVKLFVLVEGACDAVTGVSWCPDCATAAPIIERVMNEEKDHVSLIRCPLARSSYAGNAAHPYRSHPQLRLQRIPTLYRVEGGRVVDQLIETELHDIDRVRRLVRV